jgi:NitT/TauT family transport system permease protein
MTATATLWRFTPLLIIAALWEAVTRAGLISEFALPPLSGVIVAFVDLAGEDLFDHTARSLYRGGTALAAAVVVGVASGILMAWYKPVRIVVNPLMRCLYPMPKSALIPLTIMWIGLGDVSKMTLIFLGCLLPIVLSAYNAARGVEDVLLWSARGMGAKEREVLWEVVIPASTPEILNGIRTALAFAFILMVSAELIISNNGIGYLIDLLGENGEYAGMFAGVITVTVVGFAADRAYVAFTRRVMAWRT